MSITPRNDVRQDNPTSYRRVDGTATDNGATDAPIYWRGLASSRIFQYAYERVDHTADGCIVSTYRFLNALSGAVDVRRIDLAPMDMTSEDFHTIAGTDDAVYDAAHEAMLRKHGGRAVAS